MSQFDLDPWQEDKGSAEPFSLGYKKGTGEPVLYGSLLLGAALVAAGIVSGSAIPILASLPVFLSVYWHYPLIDKRAQLAANKNGLYLERLGVLRWSAMKDLSIYSTAVRTMEFSQLHIQLNGPLEDCLVEKEPKSLLRMAMRKNWRLKQAKSKAPVIEVDLNLLACKPELLLERTRQFWRAN
ncbi:hypothetical protein GCM10007094_06780 [Pseudovibrio japonicus]|uniref:DUF304 domain-containing protein n=1 Tax=Pseudovibrio japonicus TaxID=366534 RepID=A0ABQ3DZJ5_9HYPH|nr:hypothetical protein [Pseudovibrio japonicus]GHB21351.1 hypothetical protein GCM10007094_06780 [Pseudovibrio japonicus]